MIYLKVKKKELVRRTKSHLRPDEHPAWTETWQSSNKRWRIKWPKERGGTGLLGWSSWPDHPLFVGKLGYQARALSRNTYAIQEYIVASTAAKHV